MKTTFEDRLLDALKHEVEESAAGRPAPVRRRVVTPRRMAFGLAACAAAAAVGVVLPGTQAGSAVYAVEKHGDGTVTVTVKDLTLDRAEQQALAEKLRAEGVLVSIQNPPKGYRCVSPDNVIGNSIYNVSQAEREYQEAQEAGKTFPPDPESENPWSVTLGPADTMVMRNVQQFKKNVAVTQFYGTRGKAEPCKLLTMDLKPAKKGELGDVTWEATSKN